MYIHAQSRDWGSMSAKASGEVGLHEFSLTKDAPFLLVAREVIGQATQPCMRGCSGKNSTTRWFAGSKNLLDG